MPRTLALMAVVFWSVAIAACHNTPDRASDLAVPMDLATLPDGCQEVTTNCYFPDPPHCPICACGHKLTPCRNVGQQCTYRDGQQVDFVVECRADGQLECIRGACWGLAEDLGSRD